MSTRRTRAVDHFIYEEIKLINESKSNIDILSLINQQIKQTNLSNTNLLQKIYDGIYLLSVSKFHLANPLRLKKLSDRVQYSILPNVTNPPIAKLSISQLRNFGHGITPSLGSHANNFLKNRLHCQLVFYFELPMIEQIFMSRLSSSSISLSEILTNRVMLLSDGQFLYPLSLSKLVAKTIWINGSLHEVIEEEIASMSEKFARFRELFQALKHHYREHDWTLSQGRMHFSQHGVTKAFDYVTLLDDIIFAQLDKRIDEYLSHFRLSDLDTTTTFPTVAVRSFVHLKARPESLSTVENGYAIAAAVEGNGKQTPLTFPQAIQQQQRTFSLWMSRTARHLFRHQYKARVIFCSQRKENAFSLVGEQVATIALFPALVKGVFESLNLETPQSVRLIAHNEDVLTIAHDTASWVDINAVNQKASALFRLVSSDGADPLSLFEQVLLPGVGVGTFHLRTVPDAFFELMDAAESTTLPSGHHHYLLGLAYECLHEWGLAVDAFEKALRFDAKDPDLLHALGCALMEIGKIKESLPFLKRAFELMPEDPEVANAWGISNMECGFLTDAIKAFERAVRLSPGSADYLKNLGHGYLLASRPLDALNELTKAIKCDPHSAEAHATLAHIYLATGNETLAKKHAMLAYNENPVDANIANMLWRLTMAKK